MGRIHRDADNPPGRYTRMSGKANDRNRETAIGSRITVQADGCWIYRKRGNYGNLDIGQVHRFVYETLVGPIPEGHHLHHLCHEPACCNPEHLDPLTPAEHGEWHALHRRLSA